MITTASQHISQIIGFLNEHAEYAVLRNYDGLPDNNKSRDIDIIITRRNYRKIKNNLVQLINESGWKIITYLNSDRLITYVCAYLDEEHTELVQWDFFFNTSVWGIMLMDADEFLIGRKFNGFLYHVDIAAKFLDKYLYNRAVGSQYPQKYNDTRKQAEHLPLVIQKVKKLYRAENIAECDRTSGKKLLLRAVRYNLFHRPFGLVSGIAKFLWTFIGNYVMSRTGFSVGFTGPDGSGKTTVIDRTLERLGAVFATAHAYYHFRPALFGNLGEVAHSAGIKKEVDRNYCDPHRGGKTGTLSSLLRLTYYSADYILGYFVKVKSKTRITRLVIFDRYFIDIICDSRRSRIYLPPRFLNAWRRLFIPSLDYNILLTASVDTVLARKQELDREGIESINARIDYLAPQKGYYKVLNESTPDAAVTAILDIIFSGQHRKNLKRLI